MKLKTLRSTKVTNTSKHGTYATQTAEVVAKHMQLGDEKSGEISMALIEACINAFEHSQANSEVFIHFLISENKLTIKVTDAGTGFDTGGHGYSKHRIKAQYRQSSVVGGNAYQGINGFRKLV